MLTPMSAAQTDFLAVNSAFTHSAESSAFTHSAESSTPASTPAAVSRRAATLGVVSTTRFDDTPTRAPKLGTIDSIGTTDPSGPVARTHTAVSHAVDSTVSVGGNPGASHTKRALDIFSSAWLLVVLAPLLVIVALAVWVSSPGGPFFVQERVGKDGKHFRLFKYRTMRQGTFDEVMSTPHLRAAYEANGFKLAGGDAHVTRVGRVLRKTSLDELPQLWNVLRGEMSLVGIRPLVPNELAERPAADRAAYATGRPGLTGLWQVEGRSAVCGENRVALDREYIESWSLWGDAKILARTPIALVRVDRSV